MLKLLEPRKTLFMNTLLIRKMYKAIKNKGEFKGHWVRHKLDFKNFPYQQLIKCNRSAVAMGGMPRRNGSREMDSFYCCVSLCSIG